MGKENGNMLSIEIMIAGIMAKKNVSPEKSGE
jgi:hypothetical protein